MTARVLVTGGAGFIGSAFCRYVVGVLRRPVLNIDKLSYAANPASLATLTSDPLYSFQKSDICDRAAVAAALAAFEPTAIVHFAAETHVDRSITGADPFIATNVEGTFRLLEAARAYWSALPADRKSQFRFLQVSTDEVFGSIEGGGRFDESSRYDPSSPYSASKAASDHLVSAWQRTYGLPVLIANSSNTYGPCQYPEKLIPAMILDGLAGRPMRVYGTGGNVRDWMHVDDHVRALCAILDGASPGARFAVGADTERTNLEVVHRICDTLDRLQSAGAPRRRLIRHVGDRPGHDFRYAIDASKLRRELGWRPHHDFGSGLDATVRWYLDNEPWWRP